MPLRPDASGHLIACSACARHVRAREAACPFCGSVLAPAAAPRSGPEAPRLGRAALRAFGVGAVSAAAAVAGCNHDSALVTAYGGPPPDLFGHDAGADAAKPPPAPSAATPPPKAH
jgi:hypothetical protein